MPECRDCLQWFATAQELGGHRRHGCSPAPGEPLSFVAGHPRGCSCFRCYHRTNDTVSWRRDTHSPAFGTLPRRISGERVVSDLDVTDDDIRTSSGIMADHPLYRARAAITEAMAILDKLEQLRAALPD